MEKRITENEFHDLPADELQKCKDDPFYFYSKYWEVKGQPKMTREEYDAWQAYLERVRNTPFPFLKNRRGDYI